MLQWAGAFVKFCVMVVLLCRLLSACVQQKHVISSQGILCFEHQKVSFDISCNI